VSYIHLDCKGYRKKVGRSSFDQKSCDYKMQNKRADNAKSEHDLDVCIVNWTVENKGSKEVGGWDY